MSPNTLKSYKAPLKPGHTVYSFEASVVDLRTNAQQSVVVEANTKASAAKTLREMGYRICHMAFF